MSTDRANSSQDRSWGGSVGGFDREKVKEPILLHCSCCKVYHSEHKFHCTSNQKCVFPSLVHVQRYQLQKSVSHSDNKHPTTSANILPTPDTQSALSPDVVLDYTVKFKTKGSRAKE